MLEFLRIMLDARFAARDERGASAVEYGLLIAGIAALIVAVVFAFNGTITGLFDKTENCIATSGTGTGCSRP
ncbi:Flp family type IVb pilin [Nocardioides sp.]|uniref:Flp family type IVb pilin n=1 Tax=Nocardioides sp. TaxID=35761 RepID=UPI00260841CE|nr:Flp family type IVb pilin [Nocardioides sp.]